MGCGSCGTSKDGAPSGCQSHGNCSSGGCNRMNVHDWLANLPFSDPESNCRIVEVSFNNGSRKDFFRNTTLQHFEKGDMVAVEGVSGFDVGMVNITGELVRLQMKKRKVNADMQFMPILRKATDNDLERMMEGRAMEGATMLKARVIARELNLDMKIGEVEYQGDKRKATFYYIADDRVDFRELIKLYAKEFRVKIEMRQIGARQEAGKIGGLGSCGRELCCSTWLTDFKSVGTNAARYQNLSINQSKLSGQCGRLKCCLNYELDTYMDALQEFPRDADWLQTEFGNARLIKTDIFKKLMVYEYSDGGKQYPLTLIKVREIKQMNQQGQKPEHLEGLKYEPETAVKEVEFVNVIEHVSLKTIERAGQKKRQQNQQNRNKNQQNRNPNQQNRNQQARPQQQPNKLRDNNTENRNEGDKRNNQQRNPNQQNRQNNPNRNNPNRNNNRNNDNNKRDDNNNQNDKK